ncbi:MAG: hypothetical protein KDB03_25005 [Planctomycetales bacterium]|nr:hypothetical protein [Planctomycetales bacterium]
MAPRVWGPHVLSHCDRCAHKQLFTFESVRPDLPARCPKCGSKLATHPAMLSAQKGDLVAVEKLKKRPERLAVVQLKATDGTDYSTSSRMLLKRLWGFPGEQLEFVDGELMVDGKLWQKSLAQMLDFCLILDRFPQAAPTGWHWHSTPGQAASEKQINGNSIRLEAGQQLRWEYRQPARVNPETTPENQWLTNSPVSDEWAGNHGSFMSPRTVNDLWLAIQFQLPIENSLNLRIENRLGVFGLTVFPQKPSHVQTPFFPDAEIPSSAELSCQLRVIVAFCDGRILTWSDCDGTKEFSLESCLHGAPSDESIHAFELVAAKQPTKNTQVSMEISQIVVGRDIYLRYSNRADLVDHVFEPLKHDQFFVLGDNLIISEDSRNQRAFANSKAIMGRLLGVSNAEIWSSVERAIRSN